MLVLTLKVGSTLHIGEGTLTTVRVRANKSYITLASGPTCEHLVQPGEPLDFEGATLQVDLNSRNNKWTAFIEAPDDILITYM